MAVTAVRAAAAWACSVSVEGVRLDGGEGDILTARMKIRLAAGSILPLKESYIGGHTVPRWVALFMSQLVG